MTEHSEQVALFEWAEWTAKQRPELALMFAVPNGAKLPWKKNKTGQRYSPEAMKLKKEGLKSGVPDVFLPVPQGEYHGLFIEMKIKNNKPSTQQQDWLNRLERLGYRCQVCWSADEAIETIKNYLGIGCRLAG